MVRMQRQASKAFSLLTVPSWAFLQPHGDWLSHSQPVAPSSGVRLGPEPHALSQRHSCSQLGCQALPPDLSAAWTFVFLVVSMGILVVYFAKGKGVSSRITLSLPLSAQLSPHPSI